MLTIEPHQLLSLLHWSDSMFPTGGFAHSGALETYTQADIVRDAAGLARLIAIKLENAATTDMIVIHRAMSAYREDDREGIRELDTLCAASKIALETREASEKIGKRMLMSVLNLHQNALLRFYLDDITARRCAGHHAVVHGLVYAAQGVAPAAALLAFAYLLCANQTAAALKLMQIGQTQVQAVLGAAYPAMVEAVERALNRSLDEFGAFTPALDIRAIEHEHLFRRLFIS